MGASGDVAAFVVFDVGPCVEAGTGVFTTGDLTFGVVRDVEGCVTAVLTFGGASLAFAGTMGGGTEGEAPEALREDGGRDRPRESGPA